MLWKIPQCAESKNKYSKNYSSISIIIPARNEERNLDTLICSLNRQTLKVKEIILVDDGSTDKTPEIGKKYNLEVISLKNLPDGWVGKSWACYNGAEAASGDYLLFLDADTELRENGIENMILCLEKFPGVLSVQPYHKIRNAYENLSLFFNIILVAGIGTFTPLQSRIKPIGAFGPCILCKREDYYEIGGHKSIKGKVLEDIELGRKFIEAEIPLYCTVGKGTIDFRMYPRGLGEMTKGWSKGFTSGAKSTSKPMLIMVIAWIVGAVFPLNLLANGMLQFMPSVFLTGIAFYIAFAAQIYWMSYRIGNFSRWASLFYPIPLAFFMIVFLYSLILTLFKRKVTWKDREIKT